MATNDELPKRQITPIPVPVLPSTIPQKRVLEDDHAPSIPSPLNPNQNLNIQSYDDSNTIARDKPTRAKKESVKKRESKAGVGIGVGSAALNGAGGGGSGGGSIDSSRATPDPKFGERIPSESSPLRFKLAPPKPSDFDPARGPIFTHHHDVPTPDSSILPFFETSEHVFNKKSYHYLHCIADPIFPSSFYYRQTEPEPYGPHISFEDASTHMYFDQSGRHVTTDKGFRMARANVAVREGTWYWECKITRGILKGDAGTKNASSSKDTAYQPESHGHARIGFARREASLDAPVGFDAYSYGLRDVSGQKVHMSRPKDFFPPGEDMREGDVIGLEIRLPSEHLHRKIVQGQYNPAVDLNEEEERAMEAANIIRDRIPIRFKAHIYFEKIDYHTTKELEDLMNPSPAGTSNQASNRPGDKPNPNHAVPALRTLPNSYIKVYKNGELMGTPFTDLFAFLPPASKPQVQVGAREGKDDGMLGYYPAISVFRGGAVETNFGPDFWYPPPGYATAQGDTEMVDVDEDTVRVSTPRQNILQATRSISERYDEQIVEDIVADVVDEVDFWMQDGARVLDRTGGRDEKAEPVGIAPASEEIKELVQDD
ncbi:putative SPRY domain-containing protein [Rosellinia necatrix]|uniref:Putative SPRY domain-containing protein n=1 Tax=Rosellinia necatrix TaxID=77044 RepID=A0A1S7UHU6_ROSNE|nr:putative SPRY domain-containing protein [Rosellinia necatrix]